MIEKKLQIKESFKPFIIEKLGLHDPQNITLQSIYLVADQSETITKIVERDGKLYQWDVAPTDHGFDIAEHEITAAEKEKLIAQRGIDVEITQQRKTYAMDGATISFDTIEDVGLFLEVQGPDEKAVNAVIKRIGYQESQFIVKPYSQFVRKSPPPPEEE